MTAALSLLQTNVVQDSTIVYRSQKSFLLEVGKVLRVTNTYGNRDLITFITVISNVTKMVEVIRIHHVVYSHQ